MIYIPLLYFGVILSTECYLVQGFPDYAPPQFVVDALADASQQPMLQQYTRGPVGTLYYSQQPMLQQYTRGSVGTLEAR